MKRWLLKYILCSCDEYKGCCERGGNPYGTSDEQVPFSCFCYIPERVLCDTSNGWHESKLHADEYHEIDSYDGQYGAHVCHGYNL